MSLKLAEICINDGPRSLVSAVNLTLEAGQVTAVLGANRAG